MPDSSWDCYNDSAAKATALSNVVIGIRGITAVRRRVQRSVCAQMECKLDALCSC
jgi:hypothetical protein